MKIIPILLLFLVSNIDAQNQIYHTSWKKDGWGVAGGIGFLGMGYYLHTKADKATVAEINLLNRNDVPAFDRKAIDNNSKGAQKMSDALLYSSILLPLSIYLSHNSKNEYAAITVMAVEAATYKGGILTVAFKMLVKPPV